MDSLLSEAERGQAASWTAKQSEGLTPKSEMRRKAQRDGPTPFHCDWVNGASRAPEVSLESSGLAMMDVNRRMFQAMPRHRLLFTNTLQVLGVK